MTGIFKKKFTYVHMPELYEAKINLKGTALLAAIETGLIQETADGTGYDIGPFLRFWNEFSLSLPQEMKERPSKIQDIAEMIKKQSD